MELVTGENDNNRRLDRILRKALPDHPLPLLHRLLRQGKVLVNGKPAKAQDRIESGAKISIPILSSAIPPVKKNKSSSVNYSPKIIWQDAGLIAVNKPAGISVHGKESLDTIMRSFLADKITLSLSFTPGPLHRLDKPSSGIVIFSASLEGARLFSSLLKERKVKKTYLAIVEGIVKKEETWEDDLIRDREKKKTFVSKKGDTAGKYAVTEIKPLAVKDNLTLISAEIATGRTHQIRAQASAHGHPLMGDRKYGSRAKDGIYLHAWKLEFLEYKLEAPPPKNFLIKIKSFFNIFQEFTHGGTEGTELTEEE